MNLAKAFRDRYPGAAVRLRARNAIHVETAPGKFAAEIHLKSIHFGPNADLECDTSWVADSGTYQHQMALADYKAQAKAAFNGAPLVRYEHVASGQWVTLQPRQLDYSNDRNDVQLLSAVQSVTATVDDDTLTWAGAYGAGRDFKWQASTDLLAKELILQTAAAAPPPSAQVLGGANPILRLAYTFAFSSGISPFIDGVEWSRNSTATTAGAIEFRLPDGTVAWRFAVPHATDANGDVAPGLVQRLSRSGPNLLCEVRVPWSWLATAAYPVVVDPTLTLQPDEAASKDQWIWAGQPDTNRGTDAFLDAGGITANARRALVQFDLTSIPASSTVDSVTMSLWLHTNLGATTNRTARVYRIRSGRDWVEAQVTWNSYKTSNAWTTAGGDNTTSDREATDIGSALLGASDTAGTQYDFTLTASAVGEWVSGAAVNNGMIVIMDSPAAADIWRLASSNFATAGQRPKFVVEYSEGAAGVPKHFMHYARLRQ